MTIYEYNNLEDNEQYDVLWKHGKFIGEYLHVVYEKKDILAVYQLFNFYVALSDDIASNGVKIYMYTNYLPPDTILKLKLEVLCG